MFIIEKLTEIFTMKSFVMLYFKININIQIVFAKIIFFDVTISLDILIKNALDIIFFTVTSFFFSIEILESVVIYFIHKNITTFTDCNKIFSTIYNFLNIVKTTIVQNKKMFVHITENSRIFCLTESV